MQKLLHVSNNHEYDKEKRRNIEDEFENWNGRWMPDRPDDPKPPSKVLSKTRQQYEYESVTAFPHEMYMGHVSPECDDAKVAIISVYIDCLNCKECLIEYNILIVIKF